MPKILIIRRFILFILNKLSKLKVSGFQDPYKRFRDIAPKLWPNEALAIDYENNQEEVRIMFDDIKFTRGVFGNGIFNGRARGNIERSCKAAVVLRDKTGPGEDPYRFKSTIDEKILKKFWKIDLHFDLSHWE